MKLWVRSVEGERAAVSRLRRPAALTGSVLFMLVLAACGEVESPPVSTDQDVWPRCEGEGWSVQYPPSWVVHSADPARDLPACALFAREEFLQAEREDDWGWTGAQVVLDLGTGCRGSFEVSVTEEALAIEGFPAGRALVRDGHSDGGPVTAYEYLVDLSPGAECETGRWFYARTEANDPGDFGENQATLDRMIETLTLTGD